MPLPVKLEIASVRAGSAELDQVVVYAIAVARPAQAYAALQEDSHVCAVKIKTDGCTDDTWSRVDAFIDEGGNQDVNFVMLVGATRVHQFSQAAKHGSIVGLVFRNCRWDRRLSNVEFNVFGGNHNLIFQKKMG